MTHINFLSNLYAKVLQNIGGGTSRHKALIITKQFSQYCVSQSEGAQVTSARSAVDVPMTSYGASDGERWKTRGWKYVAVLVMSIANVGMAWGEITCKTITNPTGEVYSVTPATLHSYYNNGNGWVANGSGGEIGSNSYYSSKSASSNNNYIDPETESTPSSNTSASGITLKIADNRSARFYFTGAVKVSAFIAVTGSDRYATLTIYKKSDDSQVTTINGKSYNSSGGYEKIEVAGLSSSESYYAKVTATNDMCLYAMKFFASSSSGGETPDPGTGGDGECPESGEIFALSGWSTSNTTEWKDKSLIETKITGLTTLTNGEVYAVSIEQDKKCTVNGSGTDMAYSLGYNSVALRIDLDCELKVGDVITITSNGSHSNTFIFTNTNSRTNNVSSTTTNGTTKTYTVTEDDVLKGKKTIYIWRSSNTVNIKAINITRPAPACTAPTNVAISGEYIHFPGENFTLNVSGDNIAQDATYTWKKGGQVIAGQTTATLTINSCEITDAGNYTCTISNGDGCEATANYTVKMYRLRGLTDDKWTTDFVFEKADGKTATYSMELAANSSYQFKVHDGSVYYGNTGGDNPTMTSTNCTNWTMQENKGNNVTLKTTFAGTYTFTLDYTDASNPKISVTYPQKQMVYLNPNMWDAPNATEVYTVYSWKDSERAFTTMTKVNECENVYQAAINIAHTQLLFIRGGKAYDSWDDTRWNQSINLDCQADGLYKIDDWGNNNDEYWKTGAKKSWASYTGTYTPATYSITFNANGGTGSMTDVTNITCGEDRTLAENGFTRTGYTFAGWATTADGAVAHADKATINITSNITLYAKWNAETYNIKYFEAIGDDATAQDLQELTIEGAKTTYTIEEAISLPELPAKDGYTATGWYTKWCVFEDGGTGKGWNGCKEIKNQNAGYYGHTNFIVKYTPNSYTITWDANGGNVTPENSTYTYDGSAVELPTPTRDDYAFNGWFTEATGGAQITEIGTTNKPTSNVTYYAQWTHCSGPRITAYTGSEGHAYNQGEEATPIKVTAEAGNGGTLHYHWYQHNVGQDPNTQSIDAVGGTDANTYTPSTASAHEGQIFYCVVSEEGCSTTTKSAYSGAITVTAVSTPIITYNIKVTGTGTTIKGEDPTTTDGTNISTLSIIETNAGASGDPTGSNRSTKIAIKTGANGADWNGNPTNYVEFKYKVACGKKLTPSKIHIPVANVGGESDNNIKYKAVMSDDYGHTLTGTYIVTTNDGTVEDFDINNADANKYFQGEVTLKLWAWTIEEKEKGGSAFRMGTPVTIFGEVAAQATPAATITWDTHPADGTVGDADATIAAHASDGSTITYTSNNDAVATIVDGKVHYVGAGSTTIQASITDQCGNTVTRNSNSFTVTAASYTGLSVTKDPSAGSESEPTISPTSVPQGSGVTVTAGAAAAGYVFTGWTSENGTFADATSLSTTFTPSANNAVATATYAALKTITLKIFNEGHVAGWTIQGKISYPVDQPSSITVDGAWTVLTFENVYAVSNIDLAYSNGGVWSHLSSSTKITEDACYNWDGTLRSCDISECITITNFETSQHSSSSNKPDSQGKYIYGYKTTVDAEHAVTITTDKTNNKGQNSNADMLIYHGTSIYIYADNTTTGGTPATYSNVTSISLKIKNNKADKYSRFTIKVGSTTVADKVSLTASNDSYHTHTYSGLAQLNGKIEIKNEGNASSSSTDYNFYVDDIEICTASMDVCTTPTISTLNDQTVCVGTNIVAWDATQTAVLADGEKVAYSWKKKGNDTELANTATFDLGSATEAMAGTYVVTATVSADGKASSMATKEVTLTVNEATEVTAIKADKATVYPTNSVTLKATCASSGVTYQWYTCNDADGTNAQDIDGATNATYTLTAGAAGTYYYKVIVTGDGTHSCGTAEKVYALTVSAASECEKYFWFVYADDAKQNSVVNNRDNFFGSSPKTGSSNSSTYKFTLDGTEYKATRNTGDNTFSISFTVPEGSTATLALNCKGSSSKPIYLIPTSGDPVLITNNSSNAAHVVENIAAGTYKVGAKTDASASWTLAGMAVQVCTASTCTDATPTITAANTTVCVDNELKITATGYESDPTSFQWQKLNGSTWDNISGATATYTVAHAAASDAGSYRVVVTKGCSRTSNTVTIAVPSAPVFNSFTATRTVMATQALSISDVAASDATSYAWYKSADNSFDVGADTKVGTSKDLLLAASSITEEADQTFYLFCVASNSCGSVTSNAITVTVTPFVEEECATKGNEGEADFGFVNTDCDPDTYGDNKTPVWKTSSRSKYLTYTAPERKYFATAKVTVAHTGGAKCGYAYSTDRGTTWVVAELAGLSATLTAITIDLPENVNAFRISRNLTAQDGEKGSASGYFYLAEACFTYENACTETTLTPSQNTYEYNISTQADFVEPTFTLKAGEATLVGQTLTYTSSNTAIATVDEEGSVTFEGMTGTVTITASYAGNATYCASEGSYTITVSCSGGAPKIVAADGTNMSGCNSSITLNAKKQDGTDFADGTYQWFRNGEEIADATDKSYTATQTGVYTVEYTSAGGCTSPSINHATITSTTVEPEVERLVPFQYYHVDKNYSAQMKDRHLFSVKGSAEYDSTGKNFKLTMSRNGEAATDITTATSIFVTKSGDGQVDTVMIDLNKLSGKYSEGDKLVLTCAAVDCSGNVSAVYKDEITIHVIGAKPTLALICSGSSKAGGTRKTDELTVGGDFLTGYNVADLCQQTSNTTFDAKIEWGLYTDLKANYIVTPVNGYAVFNKLNYEPFDILLLTDYPKASKSPAAATVLDDMADLCDYRPMLSFKTHMVAKSPSKWAAKGFTTSPVVTKEAGRLNLNIVCYAHPMFESLTTGDDVYKDNSDLSQLVYTMLSEPGYESSKGMQGFEIAAAENFVTIGLTHYNASIATNSPSEGKVTWTPNDGDRMLVTVAERQTNIEARFILFSLNCGAQSKLTEKGEDVILACLEYLLDDDPLHVADCSLTFDNGAGNTTFDADTYNGSGVKGDGQWSTEANWGPQYLNIPGEFNSARIAAPVTVDMEHAKAMELRIIDEGSITIPAGKALEVKSTIRRMDGTEIYPTEISDIHIGSASTGNGTLIFDNNSGDTKARVDMYSTAKADMKNMTAEASTWQYIGTPHTDVTNARSNYYGSWLYQYSGSGWDVIPNGGPLVPFRGYCITHPISPNVYEMTGTLAATTTQDIAIPAGFTVIANSWVAPIDINAITDDDMEGISVKTIYFFNTGTDAEGDNETGTEAGTYRAAPIHSASYTGDWQIPSMQGFYISTETAGTLHLDYDRHVRPTGGRTIVSNPMYAPRRAKAAEEEPAVLKIFARGSRYQDKLVVLEREDFTRGYDSGWDGEAWGGGTLSPMVYVTGEGREDAVSAIPEFEGTVVAFKAGEDSEYRFEFIYSEDAEPLYLFDTENNTYTQIMTGNAYYFTTSDKAPHSRFILTRKAPQITTGTELTSDGESAKARKLLIEDKMYILLNGMLYDATGKVVK